MYSQSLHDENQTLSCTDGAVTSFSTQGNGNYQFLCCKVRLKNVNLQLNIFFFNQFTNSTKANIECQNDTISIKMNESIPQYQLNFVMGINGNVTTTNIKETIWQFKICKNDTIKIPENSWRFLDDITDALNPLNYLEDAIGEVSDFIKDLMGQIVFWLLIAALVIGVCIAIYCM